MRGIALLLVLGVPLGALAGEPRYRSPFDVVVEPDGSSAYVSDRTAGTVVVVDLRERRVVREIQLSGQPTGLVLDAPRGRLYAAEYGAGDVAEVDLRRGEVVRRIAVGLRPMGLALALRRGLLLAANTTTNDVSVVELASGREAARIKVPREPFFLAVSPDERLALAGNLLPATPASDPGSSAVVSFIDLEQNRDVADVRLPAGSTSVRELAIDAGGRRAYVAHTLGRFNLPTTQQERGWIYTNALSVLDLEKRAVHATVLLDHLLEGAANPWGVALAPGQKTLWVGLRGVHQVASVDLEALDRLLDGEAPLTDALPRESLTQAAALLRLDPPGRRRQLIDDLSTLHAAGVVRRIPLPGLGPRGLDVTADGSLLVAACYHSGDLILLDTRRGEATGRIPLGPAPKPDLVRRGEILFHDGTVSFQHWMSCSSCHPDEGRTDGLRWDLLNDGLGTPQRTRSLLWAHLTRPTTARGVRAGIEVSVPAGFYFLGVVPTTDQVEAVTAYLSSLEPEASPYLAPGGGLSPAALVGKELFEGKGGCSACHRGPTLSDQKPHDVGTAGEMDRPDERFITKRLVELYRSAPYLHDGRARDLREVFQEKDQRGRHGKWRDLAASEREAVIAYLLSL